MNEWIENTGAVPECVGPDTVIEVEYRSGSILILDKNVGDGWPNDDPDLWGIGGGFCDVIRWRFA